MPSKNQGNVDGVSTVHRSRILGTGSYLPERVVTNFELEALMDTSDAWIQQRTGIRERRYVNEGVGTSDLGLQASLRALQRTISISLFSPP